MSRLDELLQELCPDGVEYTTFGQVATIVRGASPRPIANFITTSEDGVNWIKIGDVKSGSKYVESTEEKITDAGAKKSRMVYPGDFILSNSMSFGRPYIMKISGCIHDGWLAISEYEDVYVTDFLYYLLNSSNLQNQMAQKASQGGSIKNLNADIVKALEVPVPPMEVQRELVRILDKFTYLKDELLENLLEELSSRKKQMEWYKSIILSSGDEVKEYMLEDVAEIIDCPHSSPKWQTEGVPCIRNFNLVNGNIDTSNLSYVSEEDYIVRTKRVVPTEGDIFFSREAPIGNVGMVKAGFRCCQGQRVVLLRPKLDVIIPRFLLHVLQGAKVKQQIFKVELSGTTVSNYNLSDLRKLRITVPSIDEQQRIVEMMDVMNQYSTSIDEELPAEIRCRQLQYEYYRDKLLTFERISEG